MTGDTEDMILIFSCKVKYRMSNHGCQIRSGQYRSNRTSNNRYQIFLGDKPKSLFANQIMRSSTQNGRRSVIGSYVRSNLTCSYWRHVLSERFIHITRHTKRTERISAA